MLRRLFTTDHNITGLILRLTMGGILWPHGAQKVLGIFNGPGFAKEMHYFTTVAGLSWFTGFMVMMIEFFGSLMLITGAATRIAAIGVGGLLLGMIIEVHWASGFFMDWFGTNPPPAAEGFEYHLLGIGICLALLFTGGGRYSLDIWISENLDI